MTTTHTSTNSKPLQSKITITLFFSLAMCMITTLLWSARLPLSTWPEAFLLLQAYIRILGYGLCLLWAPFLWPSVMKGQENSASAIYISSTFLSFIFLLFSPYLATLILPEKWVSSFLDVLILSVLCWLSWCFINRPKEKQDILWLLIFALTMSMLIYARGYITPFGKELAIVGQMAQDIMFHSAISNMISETHVASTGLDGITPLNYLVLSHRLIGGLSTWVKLDYLSVYAPYIYYCSSLTFSINNFFCFTTPSSSLGTALKHPWNNTFSRYANLFC